MTKSNKPKKEERKDLNKTESKVVKFKRVVTPRVNKALKAISLVGNCATKDYAYSQEDASKIVNAMHDAVQSVSKRFSTGVIADNSFSL